MKKIILILSFLLCLGIIQGSNVFAEDKFVIHNYHIFSVFDNIKYPGGHSARHFNAVRFEDKIYIIGNNRNEQYYFDFSLKNSSYILNDDKVDITYLELNFIIQSNEPRKEYTWFIVSTGLQNVDEKIFLNTKNYIEKCKSFFNVKYIEGVSTKG